MDEPLVWVEGAGLADKRWLASDRQGSVIAAANSTGAMIGAAYAYGPYGEPDAANGWSGARFRYTGQIALPELQLYHYKARVYDPGLGRFLQTDPIGYESDLNLYMYTRNDPLNLSDPDGLEPSCSDPPCPDIDPPSRADREEAAQAVGSQRGRHEQGANTYENPATGETRVVTGQDAGRSVTLPDGREGFQHDVRTESEGGSRPDGWRTTLRTHTHGRAESGSRLGARERRSTRENNGASDHDQDAMRDSNRPIQIVGPEVTGTLFRRNSQDYFLVDRGSIESVPDLSREGIVVIGSEEEIP